MSSDEKQEVRLPGTRRLVATIFGLCSLAFAGPLLALLGPAATFFSAHSAGRLPILLFTLVLFALPVVAVLAVVLILRTIHPAIERPAIAACVGGLVALTLLPLTKQVIALHSWWYLVIAVIVTIVVAIVYARNERMRSLLPWTALAGTVIAALFLFISPASAFVVPAQSTASDLAAGKSNVVVIVLDELPLAALLNERAEINAKRFPGFGELARRATWYRNAATVAPWTHLAVPAILSGSVPKHSAAPTAADYPRNLFSMLRRTHHLRAMETATDLCRAAECDYAPKDRLSLYRDAAIVYLHIVLPKQLRPNWLPELGAQWSNFGKADARERRGDFGAQGTRFERFIQGFAAAADGRPTVWFGHFLLPHLPLQYLPDGLTYDSGADTLGLTPDRAAWQENRPLMDVSRQRFLLQLKYADRLVGRTIKTLESRGLFEKSMMLVTADHGLVFQPGSRRGVPLTKERAPEILPIPLFVKYPGQTKPSVDRRPVQTIDIVPTIADVLRVSASSTRAFDGTSLQGRTKLRERMYIERKELLHPRLLIDLKPAIGAYRELFGTWESGSDVFAWGPHRALVGRNLAAAGALPKEPSAVRLTPKIGPQDPRSTSAPALVELEFDRKPATDWFAVTINGVVAGLGRTYSTGPHERGLAMLDPRYFGESRNTMGVALLFDDGKYRFVRVNRRQSGGGGI